jgi:hypothetical protein
MNILSAVSGLVAASGALYAGDKATHALSNKKEPHYITCAGAVACVQAASYMLPDSSFTTAFCVSLSVTSCFMGILTAMKVHENLTKDIRDKWEREIHDEPTYTYPSLVVSSIAGSAIGNPLIGLIAPHLVTRGLHLLITKHIATIKANADVNNKEEPQSVINHAKFIKQFYERL